MIVGVTGSWLTYRSSIDQSRAQATQAALQFTKEQRKAAYADLVNTADDLWHKEHEIGDLFMNYQPAFHDHLSDQLNVYGQTFTKFSQALGMVAMVGSKGRKGPALRLRQYHNDIETRIFELDRAVENSGLPLSVDKTSELVKDFDSGRDLVADFIAAAKDDMGIRD